MFMTTRFGRSVGEERQRQRRTPYSQGNSATPSRTLWVAFKEREPEMRRLNLLLLNSSLKWIPDSCCGPGLGGRCGVDGPETKVSGLVDGLGSNEGCTHADGSESNDGCAHDGTESNEGSGLVDGPGSNEGCGRVDGLGSNEGSGLVDGPGSNEGCGHVDGLGSNEGRGHVGGPGYEGCGHVDGSNEGCGHVDGSNKGCGHVDGSNKECGHVDGPGSNEGCDHADGPGSNEGCGHVDGPGSNEGCGHVGGPGFNEGCACVDGPGSIGVGGGWPSVGPGRFKSSSKLPCPSWGGGLELGDGNEPGGLQITSNHHQGYFTADDGPKPVG
jgi:hypothetical protein